MKAIIFSEYHVLNKYKCFKLDIEVDSFKLHLQNMSLPEHFQSFISWNINITDPAVLLVRYYCMFKYIASVHYCYLCSAVLQAKHYRNSRDGDSSVMVALLDISQSI